MIRKFFPILLIIILSFVSVINDAQAKRFGGGKTFGSYRSTHYFNRSKPMASPLQQQSTRNRWIGPLAGLAIGSILGSLLLGNGLGAGLLSWIIFAGIIIFLINLTRNLSRNKLQPSNTTAYNFVHEANRSPLNNYVYQPKTVYPVDFNADAFIREAKTIFYRLQTAYDRKDINDINLFTTPEVYAEIKMQLEELSNQENITEVLSLNAILLDASNEYNQTQTELLASVEFSGMIKEEVNQSAHDFKEIWHFKKYDNSNWKVSGIQQL